MIDLEKSSERLIRAIEDGEKIGVYGDYDVDGTTSCALLWHFFAMTGTEVEVFQPSRFVEGYGVHPSSIEAALEKNVKVLITVDCGISNTATADYANEKGVDLIITDHHKDAAPHILLAEAAASIDIFDGIDEKDDTTVEGVATAFLPDIMRIDTRKSMTVSTTAYNSDVSGSRGMLTGGRKLEDDVIDITLSYLVAGDASGNSVKDNVSYAGTPGNHHQGHKFLYKQKTRKGAAFFPFLSRPD